MKRTALQHYDRLVRLVEEFSTGVCTRYAARMSCRKGCGSCCILQGTNAVEAYNLAAALDRLLLDEKARARHHALKAPSGEGPCVFLCDDSCLVYENRPIICRTHGLPLLVEGFVDHCPLNFTGEGDIESDYVLNLENLNTMLGAVNLLFLKETGDPFYRRERIPLADIVLRGTA